MKFHFQGKYNGNPESLANQRQVAGATKFHEPDLKVFSLIANGVSIATLVIAILIANWRSGTNSFHLTGFILAIVSLFPHELLHASCFKEDVHMYTNISKGLLFVVGSEDMTKSRYVFMSLLPNIVFGFIPYIIFLFDPSLTILGTLGAFAISFGCGDYINVYNAVTQMPKDAVTYLFQQNSYWYIP